MLVVEPDAVRELASKEGNGKVVAAAREDSGTAREAVRTGTTLRPPSARL